MKPTYKEQLEQEIIQAQLQLQKLDELEQKKMKQRRLINNQLLKLQMQKQEVKATIQTNKEMLLNLQKMGVIFK